MKGITYKTGRAFMPVKWLVGRIGLSIFWFCISLAILGLNPSGMLMAQEHQTGKSEAEEKKLEIPATLPAIWGKIDENQKALHQASAVGKLDDVHHYAFAIRDYVTAMPAKSSTLAKDKQSALAKSVTRIGSLAKFLDEAGDNGDSASVATYIEKLDKELGNILALYPTGTLTPKSDAKEPKPKLENEKSKSPGY